METLYFLAITVTGGILTLFFAAGWGSFKHKKVPEKPVLFRWFVAGLVAAGLGAYAWIFGSGGDVQGFVKTMGESMELSSLLKMASVSTLLASTMEGVTEGGEVAEGGETTAAAAAAAASSELTIGMPSF